MEHIDSEIKNRIEEIGRQSRIETLEAMAKILSIKPIVTNEELSELLEITFELATYYRGKL